MKQYPVSQPQIGPHEQKLVADVLRSGWLTQGTQVAAFENELAQWFGVKHVVACSSGTTALHLALVAMGIGPGDEVLVPDLTFVATANAVSYTGATPVLVDIDPETWTISLDDIVRHLSPRTKAIIPVHLYGVPCNMEAIRSFANAAGIQILEDAAEGFGGSWAGKPLGSWGHAAAFSFYGNKILTTGEGGAVATDSNALATRLRHLRGQAMTEYRYFHDAIGFNYRITEMQAAVGRGQLQHLDEMIMQRHQLCELYKLRLSGFGYSSLDTRENYAPWLFTMLIEVGGRTALANDLAAHGIETRPTFVPLHRLPMYTRPDGEFPVASLIGDMGLSFPTYADLRAEDVMDICDIVTECIEASCAA